jgi:hypothetical protein
LRFFQKPVSGFRILCIYRSRRQILLKGAFRMLDTGQRTALILVRARTERRKRARRGDAGFAALAAALCACLAGLFRVCTDGGGAGYVPGFYGSALLYGSAGGYVLAGVLAFAAGVAVTVICIRSRKKQDKKDKNREDKK